MGKHPTTPITKYKGLSYREEEYAAGVASGLPLVEAYRQAFDTEEMTKGSVYVMASRLMDKPLVQERVRQIVEDRARKTMMNNPDYVRQFVVERLTQEAINEKSAASARIKAVELLGKVRGVDLFGDGSIDPEKDIASGDSASLLEKIEKRLSKLIHNKEISLEVDRE